MAVRVGVAPGVPERNRYSARSGLLLCRRQPAAVGGPVGLFLGCSSSSNATTRTPASRALAIPSKAAASTRRRLVAASGRKHERRTTGHGRDPDARFRRSARARAIVRPVAATSVPAGRGSARASTRLRKPGSSASRFPTGALLSILCSPWRPPEGESLLRVVHSTRHRADGSRASSARRSDRRFPAVGEERDAGGGCVDTCVPARAGIRR